MKKSWGVSNDLQYGGSTCVWPYITQLETGERKNPSLDVLKRLARALGVPVTELLE